MKNKIIGLILVFFGFFFFSCLKPKAAENISLDFDIHEHFNYYYEFIHNTKFYQFVVGKGHNFGNYLRSYNSQLSHVFFSYASDLDTNDIVIPQDSYYVIVMPIQAHIKIGYFNDIYSFDFHLTRSDWGPWNVRYLFYDINMNFLDSGIYSRSDIGINYSDSSFNNFTYILGSYYGYYNGIDFSSDISHSLGWCYSNYNYDYTCGANFDIRITNIYLDNTHYYLKNLETTNGFINFFGAIGAWVTHIFTGEDTPYDLNELGLGYFLKNFALLKDSYHSLSGIYYAFSYSDTFNFSLTVPDGYQSQTFNYNNRYYLVPNSTTCTDNEQLLYFSTSDISTINFVTYDVLQDVISADNLKTYSFHLRNSNSIEALSLHTIIGNYANITDNFYIVSSSDNFSSNTVYYNPQCYSSYSAISNNDITFENINTGNTVVITPSEQQMILYTSNTNIDSTIKESDINIADINITDIISGAWSGAKTFVSSSYYILSMVTNLFVALPGEVKGVLLAVFSIGMVVILWKVFRG